MAASSVRLPRRAALPSEVRKALPRAAGERVLVGAPDVDGRWYVGTRSALLIPDGGSYRRVAWEAIERAEWQPDDDVLVIHEVADFGEPQPRTTARLVDGAALLRLVRERVSASVVLTRFVPVNGKRGISVIGRRAPGSDAPVEWSVQFDATLSADDPLVRAAADRALSDARAELG